MFSAPFFPEERGVEGVCFYLPSPPRAEDFLYGRSLLKHLGLEEMTSLGRVVCSSWSGLLPPGVSVSLSSGSRADYMFLFWTGNVSWGVFAAVTLLMICICVCWDTVSVWRLLCIPNMCPGICRLVFEVF